MLRTKVGVLLLAVAALVVGVLGGPAASASPAGSDGLDQGRPERTYYLSLGDSLAAGIQPVGSANQGYPDQLIRQLRRDQDLPQLRLEKLGCGGETTATMVEGGLCAYPSGSQLDEALAFLERHPGQVALITIDLGANDFLQCGGDAGCAFAQIEANLPVILAELRQAAGPDVPIVAMNYYQPFVVDWFDDPAAGEAAAAGSVVFNDFLEGIYAAAGAPVADVETAFAVTDFTTTRRLPGFGPVPLSVYNACTLTWMCRQPPLGPDIHPNTRGYGVIADAFLDIVPRLDQRSGSTATTAPTGIGA
jgi:lysophospholipase L1-like esterase